MENSFYQHVDPFKTCLIKQLLNPFRLDSSSIILPCSTPDYFNQQGDIWIGNSLSGVNILLINPVCCSFTFVL